MNVSATLVLVCGLALVTVGAASHPTAQSPQEKRMQLGSFSVSLAVKDIKASKEFYEKLDFEEVGGNLEQNWLILRNGTTTIGLFQGMFEQNILTFNPGWTANNEALEDFQDVREIQKLLKERGLEMTTEADPSTHGPASFALLDPDGNPILVDQHVESPKG